MLKILLSPRAILDLEEIFDYTVTTWSFNQANKYQDSIYSRIKEIARNPEIGKAYLFIEGNYFKIKVNKHLVFYNFDNENINVVRILHEKMDLKFHLAIK